jgi:excisionase family DNA binding protein
MPLFKVVFSIDKLYLIWQNGLMDTILTQPPDVLTPEQAAAYLQLDRETIYRYIRDGKLVASKLGRAYRIPKRSIDLLLWATRTRPDITFRDYTGAEVDAFLAEDALDEEAQAVLSQINQASLPAV